MNSVKHSKPCSPEAFARLSIAKDDNERERVSKLPYLQIIGSLLYLSTMTRPDISFYDHGQRLSSGCSCSGSTTSFVNSHDNLADFFTKPLNAKNFFRLRDIIMNVQHDPPTAP